VASRGIIRPQSPSGTVLSIQNVDNALRVRFHAKDSNLFDRLGSARFFGGIFDGVVLEIDNLTLAESWAFLVQVLRKKVLWRGPKQSFLTPPHDPIRIFSETVMTEMSTIFPELFRCV